MVRNILRKLFLTNMGLRVTCCKEDLFDLKNHEVLKIINSDRSFFNSNPVIFAADPFLFAYKDNLYLFYEEQKKTDGKGVIMMTRSANLNDWTEPVLVLKSDCHMSFPFVFMNEGQVFMIPETKGDRSVTLFKANEDLTRWEKHLNILSGDYFVDSSIYKQNNVFFLFTTVHKANNYILKLYFSDKLNGKWTEHPQSPIVTGKEAGRNGGSVFSYKSKIYRPAQNCKNYYGEKLAMYLITELSTEKFNEVLLTENILQKTIPFYKNGGHQFNSEYFGNKILVATDGIQYSYNIPELTRRILRSLHLK